MAQTGYTPILIYSSSTASNAPAVGNLTNSTLGSELAINITDGKLFYKDNGGSVQVIAWKTTPTTAGGTGLTSYTAGDLLYYATGTTLSKLAIGASTTVLTSSGTAPQWTAQSSLAVGTASNLKSNATTGVMQIVGPAAAATRVMTIPDANFTAARTDAGQTFTGTQVFGTAYFTVIGTDTNGTGYPWITKDAYYVDSGYAAYITGTSKNGFSNINFYTNSTLRMQIATTSGDIQAVTGNFVQGTAAKGINFTANTPASGMTSQLLNWYEEGTWTPADASGASLSFSVTKATYTRIGRIVNLSGYFTFPSTSNTNPVLISGLPFTVATNIYAPTILDTNAGIIAYIRALGGGTTMDIRLVNGATQVLNSTMSTKYVNFSMTYQT
jgi:hypothetical protein